MTPRAPPETPRARDLFLKPFLLLFGAKMSSKMEPESIHKICFLFAFPIPCLFDFRAKSYHFWRTCEAHFENFAELMKIMKMMLPCRREHHFRGPGPPKTNQKSIKKRYQKQMRKNYRFYRCWLPFGSILASKNPLKFDTKIDAEKTP